MPNILAERIGFVFGIIEYYRQWPEITPFCLTVGVQKSKENYVPPGIAPKLSSTVWNNYFLNSISYKLVLNDNFKMTHCLKMGEGFLWHR